MLLPQCSVDGPEAPCRAHVYVDPFVAPERHRASVLLQGRCCRSLQPALNWIAGASRSDLSGVCGLCESKVAPRLMMIRRILSLRIRVAGAAAAGAAMACFWR